MNLNMGHHFLQDRESNAKTYTRSFNKVFIKGNLCQITDSEGKEYIDCLACAGALPLGHNHPYIKQKIIDYLNSDGMQQALDLATPAKIAFVESLYKMLPESFASTAKIHFCGPTGADGVEAAIKLFKTHTGRHSILSFHGAYHGMTMGALSLMGNLNAKTSLSGFTPEVQILPYPYTYRCPFGLGGEASEQTSLLYIRNCLSDPESGITKPAMIILEAIQGEGGCIPASAKWLKGIRELATEFDIPLVIDEVQTGIGRTGNFLAHQIADITPDAIVLSKAIGGSYPLSILLYHEKYDSWHSGAHTGTFRGNQLALIAGKATLDYINENNLLDHVNQVGSYLKHGLFTLKSKYPCIGDIRGRGLMLGAEIVDVSSTNKTPKGDGILAKAIKMACFANGLIIETGGRNSAVLRFLPPLVISEQEINQVLIRLEKSIIEVLNHNK